LIAPYDPNLFSLEHRLEAPSLAHLFGCDQNGADVLSQVIFGARVSLSICFVVVTLTAVTGLILGSIAGWFGGLTEQCLMRTIDLLHAFPGFLLALALVAALGPSLTNLVAALCLTGWTGYARLVRGEVLHLKNRDHVLAAVALGAKPLRIVVRHIWPNLLSLLLIQASFGMAGVVISESGLSYLGLGAPPTTPTWGALINSGRRSLLEASHLSLFPGLALFTLVLALNLVGNGLRDWLDPRNPDLRHG
jgi:peptide/nickel transport system permease protein